MKKIVIIISILVYILGIVLIILSINSHYNGELELYTYTYDQSEKLSFGYQNVKNMEFDSENSKTYWECEDKEYIFNLIKESDYSIEYNETPILLYKGYYIGFNMTGNGICFTNYVSIIDGCYLIPFLCNGICFSIFDMFDEYENGTYERNEAFVYLNHSYDELSDSYPFNLNSKEGMYNYFKSMAFSNEINIYSKNGITHILIKRYQFRGYVLDRSNPDYHYILILFDDYFGAGRLEDTFY